MHANFIKQFEPLWESGNGPPDVFAFLNDHPELNVADVVSVLLHDQRRRWQTDSPLMVEDYLDRLTDLASDPDCKLQLAIGEYQARQNGDTSPDINEFTSRFSDIRDPLGSALSQLASKTSGSEELLATYDSDPVAFNTTLTFVHDPKLGDLQHGRYRIVRLLGEGCLWSSLPRHRRRAAPSGGDQGPDG